MCINVFLSVTFVYFVWYWQRGSEFIDGVALEEYADEQDDYAQEREIEACIKAVDVDCDGKIGTVPFPE